MPTKKKATPKLVKPQKHVGERDSYSYIVCPNCNYELGVRE